MKPEDLRSLKEKYPDKSFVYVFQTTKTGNFRGANTFQHDVDIVIEIPERGKAVQFGRFNQGGEMLIFEDAVTEPAEDLNGISKSEEYPKWVTSKILDKEDHEELKKFHKLYKHKKFKSAMKLTDDWDTFLRDQIPPMIWKEIGGELTPSGEARLKRQLKKQEAPKSKALKTTAPFDPSKYSNRTDAENPQYIFNSTSTNVLVEALKGDFDVVYMVRRELANRGLDENGLWVGFEEASQIHQIK